MMRNPHIELERARSALSAVDPGCDRESWVRVMTAAKAAGLDFEAVNEWSAGAGNYKGEKDVKAVWRGLKESGGVTAGTLFHLAKESGWRDDFIGVTTREEAAPTGSPARPAVDPVAVWNSAYRLTPDTATLPGKTAFLTGCASIPPMLSR
jgi:putative DNA primase/helicase